MASGKALSQAVALANGRYPISALLREAMWCLLLLRLPQILRARR